MTGRTFDRPSELRNSFLDANLPRASNASGREVNVKEYVKFFV